MGLIDGFGVDIGTVIHAAFAWDAVEVCEAAVSRMELTPAQVVQYLATFGSAKAARKLIPSGFRIDHASLTSVLARGHWPLLLVLWHGGNIDKGRHLMQMAIRSKCVESVRTLVWLGLKADDVHRRVASRLGNPAVIKALDLGADVYRARAYDAVKQELMAAYDDMGSRRFCLRGDPGQYVCGVDHCQVRALVTIAQRSRGVDEGATIGRADDQGPWRADAGARLEPISQGRWNWRRFCRSR
jgi:hypothetical protein